MNWIKFSLIIACFSTIHNAAVAQKQWRLEALGSFELDRLVEPRFFQKSDIYTAGYVSPNARIAYQMNDRWSVFGAIQYFNKSQQAVTSYDHMHLFPNQNHLAYMITVSEAQYKGFAFKVGTRYDFLKLDRTNFYATMSLAETLRFYGRYIPNFGYEPIATERRLRQLGIGVVAGLGANFALNEKLSLMFEIETKGVEYKKEPILWDRNGYKAFSQFSAGLGLSVAL